MSQPLSQRTLLSAGLQDTTRAESLLQSKELAGLDLEDLLRQLAVAPDSDTALLLLIRLIERDPTVAQLVTDDAARPLLRLLGASEALGEYLIRRPEHLDIFRNPQVESTPASGGLVDAHGHRVDGAEMLRARLLESVGADPHDPTPIATITGKDASVALRIAYRRQLVAIAVEDLIAEDPVEMQPVVSVWLSDLATAALEAALAVSRAETLTRHNDANDVELTVIAMGKCGARELNYFSDVDVIFAHDVLEGSQLTRQDATDIAVELAAGISTVVNQPAREPALWEVDTNLRPEGQDGALSRTISSHLEYYQRWAHTWEFQALLKARPVAGSLELGQRYLDTLHPLIWQASTREGFVRQVQRMRHRVIDHISHDQRQREIKLGPGGLRDVEFPAQLLQLVHGKTDPELRVRATEDALEALQAGSYIGPSDAQVMTNNYRFLRLIEHRVQLVQLRRTHMMPDTEPELRMLTRSVRPMGGKWPKDHEQLVKAWQATVRSNRTLFEQIFYRPLLPSTAALSPDDARLTPEAATARLAALGYRDPQGAVRHIESLTSGVSRQAKLQRQILPAMLGWLASGPDPDGGLLGFRKLSESVGGSHWYLHMLRDSSAAGERLAHVLSSSRYIADMLEHTPQAAAWMDRDQDLMPLSLETIQTEMTALIQRHPNLPDAARYVRVVRRREILRISLADACDLVEQQQVSEALAAADQAAVEALLQLVQDHVTEKWGGAGPRAEVAVIAMGRQGGYEAGYGSDLDVMFVHQPAQDVAVDEASRFAVDVAKALMSFMKMPMRPPIVLEPVLEIDADLRPEGRRGPLVRSLDSYRAYYEQWADTWEIQALLKARAIAGPLHLQDAFTQWADSVRYTHGLNDSQAQEIRRMKARVEAERLPRGADPARHLKLGRGGLTDVEWLTQTLQLRHAPEHAQLRTTNTLEALEAARAAQLVTTQDAEILIHAWSFATRIRSGIVISTGKVSDVLPTNREQLEALARWTGYDAGEVGEFEDDYLRITRHARAVFERIFYGTPSPRTV
ncbi:bifunctional [glutamine synthetase] adenylyltransferase/[glutamine synthetase]-adenylyl-L-tyrosine phosphorylase [Enteractinococcus helveticum]|uniref:Bifunctional glutamine-synthetase adenylyltransferase/deadenyltransferase n=1 Tax=Enteractinococcus helveticum TaxID=1837282 RepID=A0A1B7LZB2_9MICC|nr:bifunctional [glutamine synthetase] adenylyltransferase/[glutamine synthetase]-adenylyl-L-tyrosine phosphorylase [Enteractinococcus helveticum]OAV60854.1 bifunctional glutamine-synthetase adenylyltransferase/deadenyltransferase [Enteractinococcus helveticum]